MAKLHRASFDQVRQDERARLRSFEGIAADYGLDANWVRAQWDGGGDPDQVREQFAARAAAERQKANDWRIDPEGPVQNPGAAVDLVTRAWFGRPDVADAIGVPAADRVQFVGAGRDSLARVAGILGRDASPDVMWSGAVGDGFDTREARVALMMAGTPGALPVGGLPAAVRDSVDRIIRHDWMRSGSFWRAAVRTIAAPDFRNRRWWFALSGVSQNERIPEGGAPFADPQGGGASWMHSDLQVTNDRRSKVLLSFERVVNAGGIEGSAWMSAQIALWHDRLDQEIVALLGGGAVRTNAGTFNAAHFAAAVSAVNRQTVGGVTLGSSRPVALAGENRRALMSAVPGPARASGDEAAVLSSVVYSAAVDPDFLALVHPAFMPCAVGYLGQIEPMASMGQMVRMSDAGVGGRRFDEAACVYQHRSDPALCLDSDDNAVGAVRMIA